MMDFNGFTDYVKENILSFLPDIDVDSSILIQNMTKNNGAVYRGMTIKEPAKNVCPVIYLDKFYQDYMNGVELDEIMESIAQVQRDNALVDFRANILFDFDMIKDKIFPRLVDLEENEEYLGQYVFQEYDGLACVYYISLPSCSDLPDAENSIMVSNELLKNWGIGSEELRLLAMDNLENRMEASFQSIREVLFGSLDIQDDMLPPEDGLMFVLSNKSRSFGAAMLLNTRVMDEITEKIGEFYILPSSVHECIMVPRNIGMDLTDLENMVREINASEVSREERLSNHVFLYDTKTKEFYRADHEEEHIRKNVESENEKSSEPVHFKKKVR